jgi:TonB family protein
VAALLLGSSINAQDKLPPKYNAKRCAPKIVARPRPPKNAEVHPQEDERSTGYSPVVAFQILESGKVAALQLKRSSGYALVDKYALDSIKRWRFNSRPGCGTVETEVAVTIDWASGE